jgi:lactoylglutathione lyase
MATYLHTMLRITDPEQSRRFYEALGFTFSRDMDIVRNGELEATNYFYSLGDQENVLELTYNHDGRTYDLGSGYGHIAIGVDDLDDTLSSSRSRESSRSVSPIASAKAARGSASCVTPTVGLQH